MTIQEFTRHLEEHPSFTLSFILPDGGEVPAHFHITEVGHVLKRFVDCGGTRRTLETCLLQIWVHDDLQHRLSAEKLAAIFRKTRDVIPHDQLPVEIEYEDGVVAQFPVEKAGVSEGKLVFVCGWKHTDCLARGICLPGECQTLREVKVESSCCASGGACC